MSVVTNAREYRAHIKRSVKKTLAHRKQILLRSPCDKSQDEVPTETEETVVCGGCNSESTGEVDNWIECDRYEKSHTCSAKIVFISLCHTEKMIVIVIEKGFYYALEMKSNSSTQYFTVAHLFQLWSVVP